MSAFNQSYTCHNCDRITQMKVVGEVNQRKESNSVKSSNNFLLKTYSVLECPMCEQVNIVQFDYPVETQDGDGWSVTHLFPATSHIPTGLPDHIRRAYKSSIDVRTTDRLSYGFLTLRLLNMICKDKGVATGKFIFMLEQLADHGLIPFQLVIAGKRLPAAQQLIDDQSVTRHLSKELPLLASLVTSLLESVYSMFFKLDSLDRKISATMSNTPARRPGYMKKLG